MTIQYDFFRQGGVFEGKNKVFVRAIEGRPVESEKLFEDIQDATSLTTTDLIGAVSALTRSLKRQLLMGRSVHIEGLGYFSLTIEGEVEEKEGERFYLKHPAIKGVRFRAEKTFLRELQNEAQFKAKGHSCRSRHEPTSEELEQAVDILCQEGPVFTPTQFAHAVGCSLQKAYTLLRRLMEAGTIKEISAAPRRKMYSRA